MLTLEIKINGIMIGFAKLLNTGAEVKKETLYSLEAYIPDDGYKEEKFIKTSVGHKRDDGAIILVQKAINQIVEKL
jgi:hypothetical protein